MATPQAATTVRQTPNFDFLFGRYSHSSITVPYFQVSMSFKDAAEYLTLVNDMPGAASMDWQIEELFQRDIDWARVEGKIVPYLQQEEQPQFFNSLTIALLPIKNDVIGSFDETESWNAPQLPNQEAFASGKTEKFGPITCGFWNSWSAPSEDSARIGQLAWNRDQICGVAIDGQHRLAAIKEIMGPGAAGHAGSSVPVIFLVLDKALGYDQPTTREALIGTLRRLFIDLNKHARTVNRARQILLDDRDPASICVRTVVASSLALGIESLESETPCLPLSLVDWHSEQAKFEKGPYLTTILGLDWAVAKLLSIRPFEDPMAFGSIEKNLIGKLERTLGVDLGDAAEHLKQCVRFEKPFAFSEEQLERIGSGFCGVWGPPLMHVLSELKPYKQLIERRATHDTLGPEFSNWFALRQSAEDASESKSAKNLLQSFEKHLGNRTPPIAIKDYTDAIDDFNALKDGHQLAFTVVFQRALILALNKFTKVTANMVEELEYSDEEDLDDMFEEDDEGASEEDDVTAMEMERAQDLVDALNHVISNEPDFLKVMCEFRYEGHPDRFWLCSFNQPEGPIDFTQAASGRASDLLLLVGLFWIYKTKEGLEEDAYEDLIERSDEESVGGIDKKLASCLDRMWKDQRGSIAARILNSRDKEGKKALKDDLRWKEINWRAKWLWELIHQ